MIQSVIRKGATFTWLVSEGKARAKLTVIIVTVASSERQDELASIRMEPLPRVAD